MLVEEEDAGEFQLAPLTKTEIKTRWSPFQQISLPAKTVGLKLNLKSAEIRVKRRITQTFKPKHLEIAVVN